MQKREVRNKKQRRKSTEHTKGKADGNEKKMR